MTNAAVLETNLGILATISKDKLSGAASDPGTDTPVAPTAATPPTGKVQIMNADEWHLEIRYCDAQDKKRCGWSLPIEYAVDLVRWWVEQGCRQAPWGGLTLQQRFGRIWVSLLSARVVYVRGSDAWGRPPITGFLFPRAVVEALAATPNPQDKGEHES